MNRDIRERDLVRLGQGERELDTDSDFSKWGRVSATLELRMQALAEVDRLGTSLAVAGDVGYTCETAMNFFRFHVMPKIADFRKKAALPENQGDVNFVADTFPFVGFFETAPGGTAALFKRASFTEDIAAADGCFRHLQNLLDEVER
jgi:intron-binding protein aquarius